MTKKILSLSERVLSTPRKREMVEERERARRLAREKAREEAQASAVSRRR